MEVKFQDLNIYSEDIGYDILCYFETKYSDYQ